MKTKNINVHICVPDKFISPFIEFIKDNFDINQHLFIILGKHPQHKIEYSPHVVLVQNKNQLLYLLKHLYMAKKIILHGLWVEEINLLLFLQSWLLKKCYWVMWGGDFYFPETQSWIKKKVIKKIGHFITYIKGDYELAKKWYEAKGRYHECFMYPSNLYKKYQVIEHQHSSVNIQVGNSAAPSNNHLEIFEKLQAHKNYDIKIFVPLSYGDINGYTKKVIQKGEELFGDKFYPIQQFMPFNKYLKFLGNIDIAIFAHKRQQAMGNTITLLGLGKKVYMRSDTTPWRLFNDINVKIFDVKNITLDLLDDREKKKNKKSIKEYFSEENYLKQLVNLFNSK